MDPGLLQLFVREIDRQAQCGLMAAADLRQAVSGSDMDRAWYSIQSLLIAVGNISKLLWPGKGGSAGRGDSLRQSLGIEDDSPLASRAIRNHFEHFDERLETWGISPDTHLVVDTNIGPSTGIRGGASTVYVRHFDPASEILTFRSETYELRPVIEALDALVSTTLRELT